MTQAVFFFWLQNQYLLVPNLFSGFYVFFLSVKVFFFFLLQVIINVKFKKNERVRALHFWRLKNATQSTGAKLGTNLLMAKLWFVFAEDCEPSAAWCAARGDWKVAGTFLALCMTCLLSSVRICDASVTLLVMLWIVQVSPVQTKTQSVNCVLTPEQRAGEKRCGCFNFPGRGGRIAEV